MAATMTPEVTFKTGLLDLSSMTEEDLVEAVAALPADIRARLARGPVSHRWACGVCDAFGREWYATATPDATDAMWRVWAYHEVPKAEMTHPNQLHYGELANETYRRCLATYRAAGWTGDAPEPNA